MAKPDTSSYRSFDEICDRLDQIIGQVRDKDTSLERSLDLFDEAIALGSKAVEMVDTTDFTPEEERRLREADAAKEASDEKDATTAGSQEHADADGDAKADHGEA